ncbi:pyruvate formate lyase family protein [Escherichia coli]
MSATARNNNHFYQAALLLLEASQKQISRYAELAETMAASCNHAQRRQELLMIAKISRYNAEHKPQTFAEAVQLFWYMKIILYELNASSLSWALRPVYVAVDQDIFNPGRRSRFPEDRANLYG